MGVTETALMILGIGIISEQFGGGRGLQELGTGVKTIFAAPLVGTGTGLSSLAGGFKALAESFGDIGRGLGALFESIPRGPLTGIPFAPIVENGNGNGNGGLPIWEASEELAPSSGGDRSTELAGGGGNVPTPILPVPLPSPPVRVLPSYPRYLLGQDPNVSRPTGGLVLL